MSCDHCVCMCEGVSVCVCAWQISVSVCMPQGAFIEHPWHGLSIMSKRLVESNGHPCLPNWPQIRYMNQYGSYYLQPSPACRERFCLGITLQSGLYFSVCLCQVMHFWWFRSLYLGKVLVYKIIHSCYDIPTSHTTWCYSHFSHKLLLVLQSCALYLNTCRHWMVLAVLIIASLFMLFTVMAFLGLLFCQWGKCFIMWVRISTWGGAAWMHDHMREGPKELGVDNNTLLRKGTFSHLTSFNSHFPTFRIDSSICTLYRL